MVSRTGKTGPLILSRHIVIPISPLILFPVPEKKNKAKIKRIFVDFGQLKKKEEEILRTYSHVWN